MYEGKWYPVETNLIYFLEEFTNIFLPLEIKFSFLIHKNVYFSNLFRKVELEEKIFEGFGNQNIWHNVR